MSDEQLDAESQSDAPKSIRFALQYLVDSEHRSLCQLTDMERRYQWENSPTLEEMEQAARFSGEELLALAKGESSQLNKNIIEPWVLMTQALNHTTTQRDQIESMLSSIGVSRRDRLAGTPKTLPIHSEKRKYDVSWTREPDPNYVRAWKKRQIIGSIAIGSIVAALMIGVLIHPAFGGVIFMIGITVFGNWYFMFRCPRCHKGVSYKYVGKVFSHHHAAMFNRNCIHCNLLIGAPNNPDIEQDVETNISAN